MVSFLAAVALIGLSCLSTVVSAAPFTFPLANSLPNITNPSKQLTIIEDKAHGSLPNEAPPSSIQANTLTSLQLVAFNELFEVAFFTELISNPRSWNYADLSGAPRDLPKSYKEGLYYLLAGENPGSTGAGTGTPGTGPTGTATGTVPGTDSTGTGPPGSDGVSRLTSQGFPVRGARHSGRDGYMFVVENGKDWKTERTSFV